MFFTSISSAAFKILPSAHLSSCRAFAKTKQNKITLARFILETDDPSGRTWPGKDSSSYHSSVYKHKQADGSSVKTNDQRSSSVQMNLLA